MQRVYTLVVCQVRGCTRGALPKRACLTCGGYYCDLHAAHPHTDDGAHATPPDEKTLADELVRQTRELAAV